MKRLHRVTLFCALAVATAAPADEGMWLLNGFPSERLKQRHGFGPSQDWLDQVRLSSARLAGGCSGSFVSPQGLVMTNHHCVHSCIEQLSTAKRDLVAQGFFAKTPKDELRCPEVELNQLVEISDVSERVAAATKGLADQTFNEAQKAEISKIEKECATSDQLRCDVVTLYRGGKHHLYRYHRYQDVRLVFAPELSIAHFGGDPDNFNFPRYDLDASFLRVYRDGKPLQSPQFFKWSEAGPKEGELVFVAGNPWATSRLMTVAQLELERDVRLPSRLLYLAELRGYLTQFRARSRENARISTKLLHGVENSFKALKGRHRALLDAKSFSQKVAAEKLTRAKIDADPRLKPLYGGAWDATAQAMASFRPLHTEYALLEEQRGFLSDLARIARTLVRSAEELPKPNEKRLREWVDSALPAQKQRLFSAAPIYEQLEVATLTFSLTKLREELGADHPIVRKVLGPRSPEELATAVVKGTRLKDLKVRQALFDGGQAAIAASSDPMLRLMRELDPDARAVRKRYEDEVEAPVKRNGELIAKAHFQVHGTGTYPDATATLRLSFGTVKGWSEGGRAVTPFTDVEGLFGRATGREPFALPPSWLSAKPRLDPATPMNFVADTDIIGGNSGSPVINKDREVVGLVFDGNIHSLGGDYWFDPALNRTVAVHSTAMLEALAKVYGAARLVEELRPAANAAKAGAP